MRALAVCVLAVALCGCGSKATPSATPSPTVATVVPTATVSATPTPKHPTYSEARRICAGILEGASALELQHCAMKMSGN